MKLTDTGRRDFLTQAGRAAGAAWIAAHWSGILAASQHAHQMAGGQLPSKFEVFTPLQARNVEAIASQIVPTDELPGAREAGVVYFIDKALKTFAKDSLAIYVKGLTDLDAATSEKHPGTKHFADATLEQQEALLQELSGENKPSSAPARRNARMASPDFFQTVWQHTLFGFLVDPEAGGNRDFVGWKVIGRDPAHSFSPPFGFFDKDYPGWHAAMAAMEKK
jgi:gluconate 2-dehydrogenase gamma chain